MSRSVVRSAIVTLFALHGLLLLLVFGAARGATIPLKDGRILKGKVGQLDKLVTKGKPTPGSIVMIDDGLRRQFVPQKSIEQAGVKEKDSGETQERFAIHQAVPTNGRRIVAVGPIVRITPFDKWGRRTVQLLNGDGKIITVFQGITMITPTWTEVVSLKDFIWEMRIATSSIPRETLSAILHNPSFLKTDDIEARLKIVRLYLQSDRSRDAKDELDGVLQDFPDKAGELKPARQSLTQRNAQRLLAEVKIYGEAGRHKLAYSMLDNFPAEGVAGEILQEVRDRLTEYQGIQQQGVAIIEALDQHLESIADPGTKERLEPIVKEIKEQLNINTLDRFAPYRQALGDAKLPTEEKLALAISGWLLGPATADRNLAKSISVYKVRDDVIRYMNEQAKVNRDKILKSLMAQEGSDPATLARLLAHMKPPLETAEPETPGAYELELTVKGDDVPITYEVQLPPEYDPYRKYPAVVTLHGAGTEPKHQVEWWAGARDDEGVPRGQAARHGYIVIAPRWAREHQKSYEFSAREHACVLATLRDACRRFSIDTDRVFLSGHSMGGTAAWDIGLSHPDLWAGVIPIVAEAQQFIVRYYKNARNLPIYFVGGELDGDKTVINYTELDRYMQYGFPLMIVELLGRGHESFSDEILNLFDWMGRRRRDFFPKSFECVSLREIDHFYWWVECADMPAKLMVDVWPPAKGTKEVKTEAKVNANNTLTITSGAQNATIWLTPELIDFNQKTEVRYNRKKLNSGPFIQPDSSVLLEDVRTRGDRLHPFWAKLDSKNGPAVAGK